MRATIALLPGDGVGPDVVAAGRAVLEAVSSHFGHTFEFEQGAIGGAAIDSLGTPLPDAIVALCRSAAAVLLGAVGGPSWDDPNATMRPEQGLLGIRKALGLFANLRPIAPLPALADVSPLRPDRLVGVDLLVVRELTGGIYFGAKTHEWRDGAEHASDLCAYSSTEVERVVRMAADLARARRGHLTSVDKANVLETSRLWRRITTRVVAEEYPELRLEHMLVDSCAMHLIQQPARFDVLVTENMFGDILTDEAAVIAGSIGVLPSASLGAPAAHGTRPGLYEPIHGSAPDNAGLGIANPVGTMLSAALLLRYSLGLETEARTVERAVRVGLDAGVRTRDVGGTAGTIDVTEDVVSRLAALAADPTPLVER